MISRRAALGAGLALPAATRAQPAWPDRPLRFIVSAQVGGVSDILVRILENRFRERLGQSLYVDPRPGGGGLVAAEAAIRANDRHSFTVNHIASHGIGPSLYRNRGGFDPLRDMPGVVRFAAMPNVLIVRSELPIHSVADLIGHIRANPAKANFSSASAGTSSHLGGILFGQIMGVEVTHVPYRGTAPSLSAVLNGEVLFNIDNAPTSRPHVLAGSLRAIAVSTARRATTMPELPTMQEQGVTGFDVASWYGLAAPAATPRPIVDRMAAVVLEAVADPAVIGRFAEIGAEPWPLDTDDYNAFMRAEVARWAPVVQASGASVD
ncbi:tripartite tricarboxylate transporter substrate binding protein [Paeniroseomonas aquatica]|uniref:Tripartite tricarboxylate transporter substrate binding protein n=2 Tax=Paeniroseomonas aquatica TaxID=373043 RepID=A0ABT8A8Y2_9PROT|nr:tripartite tricarboxylate transporter substrate binding protein [Paeniroseomonas aquatica]MDN3566160.1 tripartite tricarboxylate transporter substrate binding protein [Paeniroseomonas aquatica]